MQKQPPKVKKQKAKVIYRYVGNSTLYHHLAGSASCMLYNICYHFDNTAILSVMRFASTKPMNVFQRVYIHLMCDVNSQSIDAGSTMNMIAFAKNIGYVTDRQVSSRFMFRTHDALKYAAGHLLDFTWYKNTARPYFVDTDDFLENVIPKSPKGNKVRIKWMGQLD